MTIAITGAAGFIGRRLLAELAGRATLILDGEEHAIEHVLAIDLDTAALSDAVAADPRVVPLNGAFADDDILAAMSDAAPRAVVHLAAVVSGAAEADFDLGMKVNLGDFLMLLDRCRHFPTPPVLLFSSSVAVFSCEHNETIHEDRLPAPMSSYGAQKLMGEIVLRDASRRGLVRGRALRFPTISVRPGRPNKAASSFASGIIREPLAGEKAILPVGRDLRLHLASPEMAVANILHGLAIRQRDLDYRTTITLPGISVTVGEMIETLSEVAGKSVASRIAPEPDPKIEAIVASWPGEITAPRALSLGFAADRDFRELLDRYMAGLAGTGPG